MLGALSLRLLLDWMMKHLKGYDPPAPLKLLLMIVNPTLHAKLVTSGFKKECKGFGPGELAPWPGFEPGSGGRQPPILGLTILPGPHF